MLGGASLGIDLNAPKVFARIFPEKAGNLKAALEVWYYAKHSGEILNTMNSVSHNSLATFQYVFFVDQYQGPHDEPKLIPPGIAEVGNGATNFEKQRATGNLIAIFSSYQLRKVDHKSPSYEPGLPVEGLLLPMDL